MVAIAEMGDKTQLLSFMLAAKFRGKQWLIIAGIFAATVANHFFAAYVGDWVAANVQPSTMRWILGACFLAFAAWAVIPDKLDEDGAKAPRFGAFLTTFVAFFIAEMGDKTQLATVALGAKYSNLTAVVVGTTLGMMAANVPAVLLGERLARYVPLGEDAVRGRRALRAVRCPDLRERRLGAGDDLADCGFLAVCFQRSARASRMSRSSASPKNQPVRMGCENTAIGAHVEGGDPNETHRDEQRATQRCLWRTGRRTSSSRTQGKR